jgi:hypothetical protein
MDEKVALKPINHTGKAVPTAASPIIRTLRLRDGASKELALNALFRPLVSDRFPEYPL